MDALEKIVNHNWLPMMGTKAGQIILRPIHTQRLMFTVAAAATGLNFGIVSALAADLPSRSSAAPALGLQICNVGGMVGFLLPSSGVCLKISGYVASQISVGSLNPQSGLYFTGTPGASPVAAGPLSPTSARSQIGFDSHGQLDIDAREMTSYGPLRAYAELLATNGSGFEEPGNVALLNLGYIQFAGLTAGKVGSFFSYLASGATYYDFYSPDRVNGNQPVVVAYTLTLASGFSASLSLEDPTLAAVNNGIDGGFANAYYGTRFPDIVAALKVDQSWGSAQISGVAHNTKAVGVSDDTVDHWGGAALIGASLNLPTLGVGDRVGAQAVVSTAALGYSGIPNTVQSPWDQGFNMNGNGTIFQLTDALNYAVGSWSYPNTFTAAAYFEHHFTPEFSITPEISYASVRYSGSPSEISASATSWLGGAIAHWSPVQHLDFQFQMMLEETQQATPASFASPSQFVGRSTGVVGALEIVRDF